MSVLRRKNGAESGQNRAGFPKARFEYYSAKIDVQGNKQPPADKCCEFIQKRAPCVLDGLSCFETFLNVM
jgi:hypothetical protein